MGAGAEDIEDDFLAVGHGHAGEFFPISLLRRAEFVVEDEHVALELFRALDDFLRLARANQVAGMVFTIGDKIAPDDRDAEGLDQLGQFLEKILRLGFQLGRDIGAHQQRALDGFVLGLDLKHERTRYAGNGQAES